MGYDGERLAFEEEVPLTEAEMTYLIQRMFNTARQSTSFENQLIKKLKKHRDVVMAAEESFLSELQGR